MWSNRTFCARVGAVAAVVWVGVVVVWSQVSRQFYWFEAYDWTTGPAAKTAIVGLIIIAVVAAGIPWIAAASQDDQA